MEAIEYEGVEVDRCKDCQGIWFDAGESDSYRCPRCDGGMLRRVDLKQPHIHYEECTSCRGSYFDAGEFADLMQSKDRPVQKD
jgi:Zn-finger nucleic acid-binding protein